MIYLSSICLFTKITVKSSFYIGLLLLKLISVMSLVKDTLGRSLFEYLMLFL